MASTSVSPSPLRPPGLLTIVGDLVEDIVVWTKTMRPGTDNPAAIHRTRGGSAANVAALASSRVATRFIGRIGDDPVGELLAAQLADAGVDVRTQRGGCTGTIVVLVDEQGERTMFPDRGAAAQLEPIDDEWLAGTTVLHLPAYGFESETSASALGAAVESVRKQGSVVTIDVSAVSLIEQLGAASVRELLVELRPEVVFANRDEATVLALPDAGPPRGCTYVVKDGPRPTVVLQHDRPADFVSVPHVARVRDTTGAGDAFAAGFLAAWMNGADPRTAAVTGHAVAASVLDQAGARPASDRDPA